MGLSGGSTVALKKKKKKQYSFWRLRAGQRYRWYSKDTRGSKPGRGTVGVLKAKHWVWEQKGD